MVERGAEELAAENERLRQRVAILEQYLSDDLLLRLSIENGWPHEPNNPQGRWCCDEHRDAFRNGTLWPTISRSDETPANATLGPE